MASRVDLDQLAESWARARLIPTAGIKGQREQETRATSVLLAVMYAVPEFASEVLRYGGAPAGKLETYTEVQLTDADSGEKVRPDGAISVRRGKRVWRCLVEVKTGRAALSQAQVEQYVRIAQQLGVDAVMTVSNELAPKAGQCPVRLDKRVVKGVSLFHVSWFRILTEAVLAHVHRGVSDPDQAWILAELIAYLKHPQSGAGDFEDMGQHWTKIREGARHMTLRRTEPAVKETCARWEEFIQYLCLELCQHLGRMVEPVYPRKLDQAGRLANLADELCRRGVLSGALRVPDAAGPLSVVADIQARMVTIQTEIPAPGEGRPKTRINWLLRQLKDAPEELRVEVAFARVRQGTASLLREVRGAPEALLLSGDHAREPKHFGLALGRRMGIKRGKGPGSFVGDTESQVFEFYADTVQGLKRWTPRAPRLAKEKDAADEESVSGEGTAPDAAAGKTSEAERAGGE